MTKQAIIKNGYKSIPHIGNIPEDWEILSLGKIGNTYGGLTGKDKEDFGKGSPYIPYMNIFTNSIIKDNYFDFVSIKEGEKQNNVEKGDLFFTTSSETPEEVGMCSTYLGNISQLYLNSFCFGFRIKDKNKYFSLYLSNYFRSNLGRKIMYRLAQGATRYNLGKANLLKTSFGLPPIQEQQKIAEILKTSDTQIDITKNIIEKIELRNKGLQQQLLTGNKRLDGFNEEWEEKNLSECLNYVPRGIPKPLEKYLALGIRSHGKGIFHKPNSDPKNIAMTELFVVKENDLVVNITFAWEQAIAIASKKDEGGLVSHRFPTYTFKRDTAIHEYFKYLIIQKKFKYMLDLISPGGAGRNRVLSKKEFLKMKIDIPGIEEQKAIANVLNKATEQLDFYKDKLGKLELEKKGLMQQLLTGKVRVKI